LKISLTGPAFRIMDRGAGYGEAAFHIYDSFKKLGLDVEIEADKADIELCFADPGNYTFYDPDSYKIGYSAWESTDFSPMFKHNLNYPNELWGTSFWVEDVLRKLFPEKTTINYTHGISPTWKPRLRKETNKPFTFLHIGEPYSRKDAQLVVDSFIELYGNNPDYRLVLKCTKLNTTRVKHPNGWLSSPSAVYDNIIEITGMLSEEQMFALYDQSDVFVYPSWGEGFGFQPLQALAMGMPVISTYDWACYADYITLKIKSRWVDSPWPDKHPGLMMKPEKEDLKNQMVYSANNYEEVARNTFKNAFKIHEDFDWLKVSQPAVERIKIIFEELQKIKNS
jgi:glycosyltransferase involved in cell wall biosynthesis